MSKQVAPQKPSRLGWPGHGSDLPSDAEVAAAAEQFGRIRNLIWFEGISGGNMGFGASISFNPVTIGDQSSFLQVALSQAAFTFSPRDPTGWGWSDDIKELIRSSDRTVAVRKTRSNAATDSLATGSKTQGTIEGSIAAFLLPFKANLSQTFEASTSRQRLKSDSDERSHADVEHMAQITRPEGRFALRLTSPLGDDLIRYNAQLDRIPILHPPDAASLEADVKVTASVHPSGELRHALRIIDAGGRWGRSIETRNKRIVSELLLNKRIEGPVKLWPLSRRRR